MECSDNMYIFSRAARASLAFSQLEDAGTFFFGTRPYIHASTLVACVRSVTDLFIPYQVSNDVQNLPPGIAYE